MRKKRHGESNILLSKNIKAQLENTKTQEAIGYHAVQKKQVDFPKTLDAFGICHKKQVELIKKHSGIGIRKFRG